MKISALDDHQCHLGEGPLWDVVEQALYWVDSYAPRLFRYDSASARTESWKLSGGQVGSLALRERGGLILAMDQGFYAFEPQTGEVEAIAIPLAGRQDLRLNDGKVDPFGSFVAGGMNIDYRQSENCPMFRLSPRLEVEEILDGFECFNGPCFDEAGDLLYVTGRDEGVIEVFDYGSAQKPRNGRVLLEGCNPDGATVDAEGFIWSAQWDDECLLRISPDGEVDTRLQVPGQIVSSVTFGGNELDQIFVTTVGDEVHGAVPAGELPGRLLVIEDSGFRGRAESRFKG
ncbi:MAG: SMP-30/gluconolactonase/LRE family protein [Gammaproteobacteria bacterium]